MSWEQVLQYIQEHIPIIISYALTVLGYALYFIVKSKASRIGKGMTLLVKENTAAVNQREEALRQQVLEQSAIIKQQAQELQIMMKKLNERMDKNEQMVAAIADVSAQEFIAEEVVENGPDDSNDGEVVGNGQDAEKAADRQSEVV